MEDNATVLIELLNNGNILNPNGFSLACDRACSWPRRFSLPIGLSRSLQATSRKSTVTNPCAALNIGSADCPRYRATNMEVIELDTGMKIFFPLTFGVVLCLGLSYLLFSGIFVFVWQSQILGTPFPVC